MLVPNSASRRKRNAKQSNRALRVESLEDRRLLSSDGILPTSPDVDRLIAPGGVVAGTKWEDVNADGQRGPDEVGLAGVKIYADANGNARFDDGERWTTTAEDNPDTRVDESGNYNMWLEPGKYTIREVVPKGYAQTFPLRQPIVIDAPEPFGDFIVEPSIIEVDRSDEMIREAVTFFAAAPCDRPLELDVQAMSADGSPEVRVELVNLHGLQVVECDFEPAVFELEIFVPDPEVTFFELSIVDVVGGDVLTSIPVFVGGGIVEPGSGGHDVKVDFGTRQDGLDFGNTRIGGNSASIEGRTWNDQNGNGKQGDAERSLGGVEVYLDTNSNGEFDRGERSTRSQFDDPVTDFDEGGLYRFDGLRPGNYTVREVVPNGYVQTYPTIEGDVLSSETGQFQAGVALDFDLVDVSYAQANDATKTSVSLSVQWPNGCGFIDATQTSYAVIGDTILVDAHGGQSGDICTEALTSSTIEVSIPGLDAGNYSVVGTLHEGSEATLGVVGEFEIGASGAHFVEVAAGEVTSGVDFGNRRTGSVESISGIKWNDQNGDSARQRNELGLGGVTIYVDANHNSQLDEGEISTVTSSDPDNLGAYQLVGVEPGYHEIREVVPEGYRQTFPYQWFHGVDHEIEPLPPGRLIPHAFQGSHYVEIFPGDQLEGLDFGNQSTEPSGVSGTKWLDVNGNGSRDEGEAGLAGVTIYVDINGNWAFDEGEPSAVSNDSGDYKIGGVKPGTYAVREVVPEGYHQTFPRNDFWGFVPHEDELIADPIWRPFLQHHITFQPGEAVEGIDFGNQKTEPGSISGIKWNDVNGNGIREAEEAALAGVTIYIDQNYDGVLSPGEPSTVTATDNPDTADDETGRYRFGDLKPLATYNVREVVPEGYEQTFPEIFDWQRPVFEGETEVTNDIAFIPFASGAHNIYVGSGQAVEQINFGNRKIPEPGFVTGSVWADINGNGIREADESGHSGVQVFADANLNGRYDRNEIVTTTQADDPNTDVDETGQYTLKVRPGFHLILQSTPPGAEQTYPEPSRKVMFPYNLGNSVTVEAGQTVENVDFGNKRVERNEIGGTTWFDANANGVWDRGEQAHNLVTVYLDQNDNGQLDKGEVSTVSGVFDGPGDGLVAAGSYHFNVVPGDYIVRQVTPFGFAGTYPNYAFEIGESVAEPIEPINAQGLELLDVFTASTSANDAGQTETYLNFLSTWSAAVDIEVSVQVEGNQIEIDFFANTEDVDDDIRIEHVTSVNVGSLELGDYEVIATSFESMTPAFRLHTHFVAYADDAHRVSVTAGENVEGLNFGSIATPVPFLADSKMGEDPHSHLHNETATEIEFHNGHVQLNSYVDVDSDQDVFRFIGNGNYVSGEGGRVDGENRLTYEILDGEGNTIAMSAAGVPVTAPTIAGETYYVRVSGAQGQYQLDLLEQEEIEPETTVLQGDTDRDGDVDFRDFLVLSSNFGSEVDAAFADADFDGDGTVSFVDFLVLSENFGSAL